MDIYAVESQQLEVYMHELAAAVMAGEQLV